MSEASEILAELQATVGLAKLERRADAWRWLEDIDRLASRLETAMQTKYEAVNAAIAEIRAGHEWGVLGDGVAGWRAVCPCGWRSDDLVAKEQAHLQGSAHSVAMKREREPQDHHSWVVLGDSVIGYQAVCPCGWETDRYPNHETATEAGKEHG